MNTNRFAGLLSTARNAWSKTHGSKKIGVHPMSLGSNQQPLEVWSSFYALGCLMAYAKVHSDGALHEHFDFHPITPTPAHQVSQLFAGLPRQSGVFLFSSYVWNHKFNTQLATEIKRHMPGSLTVIGGPEVPRNPELCEKFFADHPCFDVAVRQEGEITLSEILAEVARAGGKPSGALEVDLSSVPGLTFRRGRDIVRTPDRPKTPDLAIFPSPYITGEFNHWIDGKTYVPIETNRGCPYGCTFCDWGAATLSKVARMSLDRVLGELEFAARHKIHNVGVCDANFGILPRDVDIARFAVEMKKTHGYPREFGYTNAKTASPRLTEIIQILHEGGLIDAGQISIQTTDETILSNVKRDNIKMSEYRKIITFFHKQDIPAVSDIMLGLPGQTLDTCKKDLQFCFDHKVTAMLFATSVMPNAPMADPDYREKYQIRVDKEGFVESTYSFTREEYARMFDLGLAYKLFVKLGLLKYLLYFVQIEHGVKAVDFIERWVAEAVTSPGRYPISARIWKELVRPERGGRLKDWLLLTWSDEQASFLFNDLDAFYTEILRFFREEHGVNLEGSDVQAVLKANREVMPKMGRALPAREPLDHDVAGYFEVLRALPSIESLNGDLQPLKSRGPGYLDLPVQAATTNSMGDMLSVVGRLELASNMRI